MSEEKRKCEACKEYSMVSTSSVCATCLDYSRFKPLPPESEEFNKIKHALLDTYHIGTRMVDWIEKWHAAELSAERERCAGIVEEIKKDIQKEIDYLPQYPNLGKKFCVRNLGEAIAKIRGGGK